MASSSRMSVTALGGVVRVCACVCVRALACVGKKNINMQLSSSSTSMLGSECRVRWEAPLLWPLTSHCPRALL